jgi:ferritin-like metal-binding protein YciE
MQLQTLRDLFVEQLQDLYSAETREHVTRLERILGELGSTPGTEICKGMQGLIAEGEEVLSMQGDPSVIDAALIAAAQRVEHYEIAGYGTAKTLAGHLDLGDAKDLLDDTLDEEGKADKLLTKIATGGMFKSGINQEATR